MYKIQHMQKENTYWAIANLDMAFFVATKTDTYNYTMTTVKIC